MRRTLTGNEYRVTYSLAAILRNEDRTGSPDRSIYDDGRSYFKTFGGRAVRHEGGWTIFDTQGTAVGYIAKTPACPACNSENHPSCLRDDPPEVS